MRILFWVIISVAVIFSESCSLIVKTECQYGDSDFCPQGYHCDEKGQCKETISITDGGDGTDGYPSDPVDDMGCGPGVVVIELNTEGQPIISDIPGGYTYKSNISAGEGGFDGKCQTNTGKETIFKLYAELSGDLLVDTRGSDFDTVLHVRTECLDKDSEIACHNDIDANNKASSIEVLDRIEQHQPVFIFADSLHSSAGGQLNITARVRRIAGHGQSCDHDQVISRCSEVGEEAGEVYCAEDSICRNDKKAPILRELQAFKFGSATHVRLCYLLIISMR